MMKVACVLVATIYAILICCAVFGVQSRDFPGQSGVTQGIVDDGPVTIERQLDMGSPVLRLFQALVYVVNDLTPEEEKRPGQNFMDEDEMKIRISTYKISLYDEESIPIFPIDDGKFSVQDVVTFKPLEPSISEDFKDLPIQEQIQISLEQIPTLWTEDCCSEITEWKQILYLNGLLMLLACMAFLLLVACACKYWGNPSLPTSLSTLPMLNKRIWIGKYLAKKKQNKKKGHEKERLV